MGEVCARFVTSAHVHTYFIHASLITHKLGPSLSEVLFGVVTDTGIVLYNTIQYNTIQYIMPQCAKNTGY